MASSNREASDHSPMVKEKKPKLLHTKECLILATIEVIHENGLQGLTTRAVAKKQGISESTIFKHYKNKNELIIAVLGHFSQYDTAIIESIKSKDLHPIEAITLFVDSYVTYYENYPEITSVVLGYEGLVREPELCDIVKGIFNDRTSNMKYLIEEAKRKRNFKEDLDCENLTDVIIGLERVIILNWRINNYSFSLRERTLATLKTVLGTFSKAES